MNSQTKKVLYVEDNANNRFLMEMVFKKIDGVDLALAFDAEQAMAQVKADCPNLILMDKNLPGMNGIEAVKVLKSDPKFQHIPIIMLTAQFSKEVADAGKLAGCLLVLGKPFEIVKLIAQIETIVGVR